MGSKAGNILKAVLPIAATFIAPYLAPALGITSLAGTAALGAGIGGIGGAIGGGGLKGALLGGLTGGLGAGGGDLLAGGLGLSGTGASIASKALTGAATGYLGGGDGKSALLGGLVGGASGGLSKLLSGGEVFGPPAPAGLGGGSGLPTAASGASSVANTGGIGSSFAKLGNSTTLSNLLSGVGNVYAQDKAEDQLVKSQQKSLDALAPYLANGTDASNRLNGSLDELTTPFSPDDLQNDPGYQFNLGQGTNALNNQLAASGMLGSGAALKAAQQFGQGLADTTYNAAFNRDLQSKQNTYNTLSGAAAPGLSAGVGIADINSNIGAAQSKATAGKANTITSTLSGILSGAGAKTIIGYKEDGTPIYA